MSSPLRFVSETELLAQLQVRECAPLSPGEVLLLQSLVRRATGGCELLAPSPSIPLAKLPGAWLCEFNAMAAPHVMAMAGGNQFEREKRFYDPVS